MIPTSHLVYISQLQQKNATSNDTAITPCLHFTASTKECYIKRNQHHTLFTFHTHQMKPTSHLVYISQLATSNDTDITPCLHFTVSTKECYRHHTLFTFHSFNRIAPCLHSTAWLHHTNIAPCLHFTASTKECYIKRYRHHTLFTFPTKECFK